MRSGWRRNFVMQFIKVLVRVAGESVPRVGGEMLSPATQTFFFFALDY
jgi:hypothetical protein